jgi:hypothetical protein
MSKKQSGKTAKKSEIGTPTPAGYITPEPQITSNMVERIIEQVEHFMEEFMRGAEIDTAMTGRERQRLFGVKSRKYGFINKAWDIAQENPNFLPPNFTLDDMREHMRIFEQVRQLTLILEQFQHAATDYLMLTSDNAYRDALRIYGSLREQSRGRVPGADALFRELLQFFTLHRRGRTGAEPTEKELERDFKAIVHGHKDGEIIVKNVSPKVTGGERTVIDSVHTGHSAIKETVQESEKG